jgi:hypothetical protein
MARRARSASIDEVAAPPCQKRIRLGDEAAETASDTSKATEGNSIQAYNGLNCPRRIGLASVPPEIRVLIAEHLTCWSDLQAYRHVDSTNQTLLQPLSIAYIKNNPLSESQKRVIGMYSQLLTGTSRERGSARSLCRKLLQSGGVNPELIVYPEFVHEETAKDGKAAGKRVVVHKDKGTRPNVIPMDEEADLRWGKNKSPEGIGRDEVRGRNLLEVLRKIFGKTAVCKVEGVDGDTVKRAMELVNHHQKRLDAGMKENWQFATGLSYYFRVLAGFSLHATYVCLSGGELKRPSDAWKMIQCEWICTMLGDFTDTEGALTGDVLKSWLKEVQSVFWFQRELLNPHLIQDAFD